MRRPAGWILQDLRKTTTVWLPAVAGRHTDSAREHTVDSNRRCLVVVGNGMAGVACVEQILKHAPRFDITIFGDETHVNYNRILLSSVLAGERSADEITLNPLEW